MIESAVEGSLDPSFLSTETHFTPAGQHAGRTVKGEVSITLEEVAPGS